MACQAHPHIRHGRQDEKKLDWDVSARQRTVVHQRTLLHVFDDFIVYNQKTNTATNQQVKHFSPASVNLKGCFKDRRVPQFVGPVWRLASSDRVFASLIFSIVEVPTTHEHQEFALLYVYIYISKHGSLDPTTGFLTLPVGRS